MKKFLILICIIAILSLVYYFFFCQKSDEEVSLEQKCVNAGGRPSISLCCQSANDFPDLCLIGACGCSPDNSKEVQICDCGSDKCWDGNNCVSSGL